MRCDDRKTCHHRPSRKSVIVHIRVGCLVVWIEDDRPGLFLRDDQLGHVRVVVTPDLRRYPYQLARAVDVLDLEGERHYEAANVFYIDHIEIISSTQKLSLLLGESCEKCLIIRTVFVRDRVRIKLVVSVAKARELIDTFRERFVTLLG